MVALTLQSCSKVLRSKDQTEIYADSIGDPTKQAIVFIHGFSLSSIVFDHIFNDPVYVDNFYLVRYDTRGHGRSGKPYDEAFWESERLADDFDAVIKGFDLTKPFVVGWSVGATHLTDILSFHAATDLAGIIVVTGIPFCVGIPALAKPFALNLLPPFLDITDVVQFQKTSSDFISSLLSPTSTPLPHFFRQALLGDVMTQPRVCTARLLSRTNRAESFLAAGLKGLPLLIVTTSDDLLIDGTQTVRAVQTDEFLEGYTGWENLTVNRIEGAGHMPWFERPEEFQNALFGFISRFSSCSLS